jgi:hypothetical protein
MSHTRDVGAMLYMHGYFRIHQNYLQSLSKTETGDVAVRILLNDSENIITFSMCSLIVGRRKEMFV